MRFLLVSIFFFTLSSGAQAQPFSVWLENFKQEAQEKGVDKSLLDDVFRDIQPQDDVISYDRKQPETTVTFDDYIRRAVSPEKIEQGKEQLRKHHALLTEIGRKYGVEPEVIVALWGMESRYGENSGSFDLIDSLATLAYDGRRSSYFRRELINALLIMQQDHIDSNDFTGSWAGAMGQCQFMPTSFLKYAVDYDGDGKRNIWSSEADVFASAANYLSTVGWEQGLGWGFQVHMPQNVPTGWRKSKTTRTLRDWAKDGLTMKNGDDLPAKTQRMRLIFPEDNDRVAYLVTSNYNTLLDWNRSVYFATAVSMLADAIKE